MHPSRAFAVFAVGFGILMAACGGDPSSQPGDIGVDASSLGPVVDHPYVAFEQVSKTVHQGEEFDPEDEVTIELRIESEVLPDTRTIAGVEATVVEVTEYEDDELVEITLDYYAQGSDGTVYYLGEDVDEYEDGDVVGHGGAWLAGEDGAMAGVFMPSEPEVGDEFEQERAPGAAEDESKVVATGVSVTVAAGSYEDCIETEDLDPIDDVLELKFYCPDVGLVREVFPDGGMLDLVEFTGA